VFRLYDQRGLATVDLMALADEIIEYPLHVHHHHEAGVSRVLDRSRVSEVEDLLVEMPLERPGDDPAVIDEARKRRVADLERLDPGVKRLVNPHVYHVSVTSRLAALKAELAEELT
jgi:nicotinate phosphoribosyltransferase